MKMIKVRKPRGMKLDGTRSEDMCSCYSFGCDPMAMSQEFQAKIRRRQLEGTHPACGQNPCICKSKSGLTVPQMR